MHINTASQSLLALIPAYCPSASLVDEVRALLASQKFAHIFVVNDGSPLKLYQPLFDALKHLPQVTVLEHRVNQGKGAALKTGLKAILADFPSALGVVTLDADGQHALPDILRVAQHLQESPDCVMIGSRRFDQHTPLRSRMGNYVTRHILRWVKGLSLSDTQSGLRGLPLPLLKDLVHIEAKGYEFELDMLIYLKQMDVKIHEVPIQTIYLEGNKSSHFHPFWDSLKIYFVLLRFSIIAFLSALLDYGVFILIYCLLTPHVFIALMGGRIVSLSFNYLNVRRYAFRSQQRYRNTLPQYLLLALFSGVSAAFLIEGFMRWGHFSAISAKIMAEVILFFINFMIQRDFIFRQKMGLRALKKQSERGDDRQCVPPLY